MKDDERRSRPQRECKRRLGGKMARGEEGRGERRLLEEDQMQANRLRERRRRRGKK